MGYSEARLRARPAILVTGPPGSGKTTWVKALLRLRPHWRPAMSRRMARAVRLRSGSWRIPLRLRLAGVLKLLTEEDRLALQATSRPEQILDAYPGIGRALLRSYAEADLNLFPVASQRYTDLVKAVYRLHLLALQLATPGPPTIYEEESLWHKLALCESRELMRSVPAPDAVLVLEADDPCALIERRTGRGARHDRQVAQAVTSEQWVRQVERQVEAWQKLRQHFEAEGIPVRAIDCHLSVNEQAPQVCRWLEGYVLGLSS